MKKIIPFLVAAAALFTIVSFLGKKKTTKKTASAGTNTGSGGVVPTVSGAIKSLLPAAKAGQVDNASNRVGDWLKALQSVSDKVPQLKNAPNSKLSGGASGGGGTSGGSKSSNSGSATRDVVSNGAATKESDPFKNEDDGDGESPEKIGSDDYWNNFDYGSRDGLSSTNSDGEEGIDAADYTDASLYNEEPSGVGDDGFDPTVFDADFEGFDSSPNDFDWGTWDDESFDYIGAE